MYGYKVKLHMSGRGKLSKHQRNKKRNTAKRKASGSPNTSSSSSTHGKVTPRSPCTACLRQTEHNMFNNSVDFVSAVMNPSTSPGMNFSTTMPFTLQPQTPTVFQTPTMYHGQPGPQQSTPIQSNIPPEDVRSLKA